MRGYGTVYTSGFQPFMVRGLPTETLSTRGPCPSIKKRRFRSIFEPSTFDKHRIANTMRIKTIIF